MDIQFTRGRLMATVRMLEHLRDILETDLGRVAVACHDDHGDDPAWQSLVSELTAATANLLRARDHVERASNGLLEAARD